MLDYRKMLAVAVAVACAGLAGCDNTAQGVKEDAAENKARADQAAEEAKADTADERADLAEAGREAGDAIQEAGRDLGNAAERAANDAAPAVDAAKQTLDVKTALMADSSIDATKIDVDTDAGTKTVTLKGTVATAAQKTAAERIAKSKAEGYTVRNNLTVSR